jgi:Domain of unknown function (DUF4265)
MAAPTPASVEHVLFALNSEDGWPPVKAEPVPCRQDARGYVVLAAPFFVSGISAGDILDLERNVSGEVTAWSHLAKSRHSTLWLLGPHSRELATELSKLRAAGCSIEDYDGEPLSVIDAPPTVATTLIDQCIGAFKNRQVAVAYPSWRHDGFR